LDRFGRSLGGCDLFASGGFARLPDLQHGFLEQPHVAWSRLQQREFLGE
jgi:hypothetical protein